MRRIEYVVVKKGHYVDIKDKEGNNDREWVREEKIHTDSEWTNDDVASQEDLKERFRDEWIKVAKNPSEVEVRYFCPDFQPN